MRRTRQQGFTLIEVMVTTAILAVIGGISLAGIDGLLKARAATTVKSNETSQIQVLLGQWSADLDQAFSGVAVEPMDWDGKVYRVTRRALDAKRGLQVIAWAVRNDGSTQYLMRWKSDPALTVEQWQQRWNEAAVWGRAGAGAKQVKLTEAQELVVQYWHSGTWVNAQSSTANAASGALTSKAAPDGVRMVIRAPKGDISKVWSNPAYSEAKS